MLYSLCYQENYPGTVVVTRSASLLKLLKIKAVTFGNNPGAFITNGREQFNKFDLIADECARYSDFEVKTQGGRYFPTYDYRQRAREAYLATLQRRV